MIFGRRNYRAARVWAGGSAPAGSGFDTLISLFAQFCATLSPLYKAHIHTTKTPRLPLAPPVVVPLRLQPGCGTGTQDLQPPSPLSPLPQVNMVTLATLLPARLCWQAAGRRLFYSITAPPAYLLPFQTTFFIMDTPSPSCYMPHTWHSASTQAPYQDKLTNTRHGLHLLHMDCCPCLFPRLAACLFSLSGTRVLCLGMFF